MKITCYEPFSFFKQCYVVKTTKVTSSAFKSSPKQVVEQEITHVRNKNRGINTEYVSLRQDRPKTGITGLRPREQR